MDTVQLYAEIEPQFNYQLNFICWPNYVEPEKVMTRICKVYDKNM